MTDGARHIDFEACWNFRDMGGYATVDGRQVRSRVLFRSDALHRLTTADLELAQGLGIRTVIDLRSTVELADEGRFALADEVAFHHVPVFEQDALPFVPAQRGDPAPPPGEDYVAIATAGRDAIATTMRVIAEAEYAAVFHCAAGKDRTGVVAALLLSVLGVPDDVIVADYHLTDERLPRALAWAESNDPVLAAEYDELPAWLIHASQHVMQAFLDLLRARHGSIEGYLLDAGLDDDVFLALRSRLLQGV